MFEQKLASGHMLNVSDFHAEGNHVYGIYPTTVPLSRIGSGLVVKEVLNSGKHRALGFEQDEIGLLLMDERHGSASLDLVHQIPTRPKIQTTWTHRTKA